MLLLTRSSCAHAGPAGQDPRIASTAGITSRRAGWRTRRQAAVVSLSTLADELAGTGIKVYSISPGRTATELRHPGARRGPGQIMQPSAVAEVIATLMRDEERTLDGRTSSSVGPEPAWVASVPARQRMLRVVGVVFGWLPSAASGSCSRRRGPILEGNRGHLQRHRRAPPDRPVVLLLEPYGCGFAGKLRYLLRLVAACTTCAPPACSWSTTRLPITSLHRQGTTVVQWLTERSRAPWSAAFWSPRSTASAPGDTADRPLRRHRRHGDDPCAPCPSSELRVAESCSARPSVVAG
jgi:hypothetical protein